MGVDVRAISIYGIKIDYDKKLAERIDELDHYKWESDPHILVDGMCGEYMILGPVLFNSGSHRWDFEGDTYKSYSVTDIGILWLDWKLKFEEKFSDFSLLTVERPKFITLMHYS